MGFLTRILGKYQNWRLKKAATTAQKTELADLAYEEEALKRIKRINELGAEVDSIVRRRLKKGIPDNQKGTEAKDLKPGTPLHLVYGNIGGKGSSGF